MQRSFMAIAVCLAVFVLSSRFGKAEVVIACDPEPTDMVIESGNFLDGTHCAITPGGDTDTFRFFAAVGEVWIAQATDQSGSFLNNVCLRLLGPDGLPTPNGAEGCADVARGIMETIQQAGIHTLRVREAGAGTFSYGLVLERVVPPSPAATPLCFGCNLGEVINGGGDIDIYIFNGVPGDVVIAQATDQSGSSLNNVCLRLWGPDGLPTPNGAGGCTNVAWAINETIQQAGIHTLRVQEAGAGTMPYSVDLQCVSGSCQFPPGISVTPPEVDFVGVPVGSCSTPQIVTVSNMGAEDSHLVLGNINLTGPDAVAFSKQNDTCSGQTLLPTDLPCTLEVVFCPASSGLKEAMLTVPSNDFDTPVVEVPLSGTDGVFCDDDSGQLDIRNVFAVPGTPGTVPVEVHTAPNELRAFGFEVAFDPAKLTFDSFTPGPLTQNFDLFDVSNPAPGVLRIAGVEAGAEPIVAGSSGIVVNLTFLVDGAVPHAAQIPLHLQNLVDQIAPFTTTDGCITTGCPHDGKVTIGDDLVTPSDALLAFQFFLGQIELTDCQQDHADVKEPVLDPGSNITPADALCIFEKFLQKPSCLDG